MIIGKNSNGEALPKISSNTAEAIRLIHRISSRRTGMKEDSLVRLVQYFVMIHITYAAACHNWRVIERAKINTLIRKAYKSVLGVTENTSTTRLLQLEVHNTVEEIEEAQLAAQLERLPTTKTGRQILKNLGYNPVKPDRQQHDTKEEAM